ncbi:MAG: OB-fold domain-containing protein [Chloroflexota bacterium]|nr:OB-fold domain-containing protein [Chloroflexota bacterium]
MVGIASYGAYIPLYRLSRQEMSQAWGIPGIPGERAVANADEDSITMGVAAGLECLAGVDPASVDALYFATTTAPYAEKQSASVIAAALDLRPDIFTADFTDSLRSATVALRAAHDALESGSAKSVLVVAADNRPAEPETMWEQILGDGAGAVLLSKDGAATVRGFQSVTSEVIGPWRRSADRYVRAFEPRVETQYGYMASMVTAAKAVAEKEGVGPKDIAKAVLSAGDPRSHGTLARQLGLEMPQLQDTGFLLLGNTGTPQVLMMLAAALDTAKAGDRLLVANYGDGADAFLVEVSDGFSAVPGKRTLQTYLLTKRMLPNYSAYAGFRHLMERERYVPKSSPVIYWRDSKMELALYGARCRKCGTVQYPPPRVCVECATKDELDSVKLARKGTVFTFTLDHLVGGAYLNIPVPRVVADLEGGGRIFLEMTDCDPTEVKIGMLVELTLRCLHEGAAFHNYYWKCQPIRGG